MSHPSDLPKLKPIPLKDRISHFFIERGHVDVIDRAFVILDKRGVRKQLPIGGVACVFLGPGTRISHEAVKLAAQVGTLLIWIGENGVRVYSAGQPGGARTDRMLYQAQLALEDTLRLKVVRKMYEIRFGEEPPARRSVEQLRGLEGARVRELYQKYAKQYGLTWEHRKYDPTNWDASNVVNKCISTATSCLYGISEAAVLAAGYLPALGFIHTGKSRSFVFDIADIFKFETVVPIAFKIAAQNPPEADKLVRHACRDSFKEKHVLKELVPMIERVLAAGGIAPPPPAPEAMPIAFPDPEGMGDVGHRT